MRKKGNYIAIKIDSLMLSQIKAFIDVNSITLSEFIRNAIAEYFNRRKIEADIDRKILDYEKLTSLILETHNNQKRYFRNLLETLITISPKDKDTIIDIWKGDGDE